MNPDTIGCVWTGESDLNTLRVDGKIFESGKKKLRIQKYPDTCGRGRSRIRSRTNDSGQLTIVCCTTSMYDIQNRYIPYEIDLC